MIYSVDRRGEMGEWRSDLRRGNPGPLEYIDHRGEGQNHRERRETRREKKIEREEEKENIQDPTRTCQRY